MKTFSGFARCPACNAVIRLNNAPEMWLFDCPVCHNEIGLLTIGPIDLVHVTPLDSKETMTLIEKQLETIGVFAHELVRAGRIDELRQLQENVHIFLQSTQESFAITNFLGEKDE